MNPADDKYGSLPRYGLRADEKTRPCVVLFDWNGDDESTVFNSRPEQPRTPTDAPARDVLDTLDDLDDLEELDEIDLKQFRPRWHGIGRHPGAIALGVVLLFSFTIGALAIFGSNGTPIPAANASSVSRY